HLAQALRRLLYPVVSGSGELIDAHSQKPQQSQDHERGAQRFRNVKLFQAAHDRAEQEAEQDGEDDRKEESAAEIEGVEGGEKEQAGQRQRADAERTLEGIAQFPEVGARVLLLLGRLLPD